MVLEEESHELEDALSRFEAANPELVHTIELLGLSIDEYNNIVLGMSSGDIVTSNTTES